jgi:hypothetical protein
MEIMASCCKPSLHALSFAILGDMHSEIAQDVSSSRKPSSGIPSSTPVGGDGSPWTRCPGPARSSNLDEGSGGFGIIARKAFRTATARMSADFWRICDLPADHEEARPLTSFDEPEELAVGIQLSDHVGQGG